MVKGNRLRRSLPCSTFRNNQLELRFQLPHARCDRHDRDTFRFLHAPFETTPALTGFASRGASDSVAT
ncbi:hypothetical protein VIGAN_01528800 [Vigna angularis var. angularis]|uniref:Uncharacterized protein n=1 Tax=Vigna angularis var. angularis TaxID=157739 RepID=A0A0S3R985_PHAAN|nr:hypothetical protein VIGAN_01528800 [Vigna angularis var. angularis]